MKVLIIELAPGARVWHVSSAHADDARADVTWWHDDAPMRNNMRALCDVFADVAWALHRADGSLLQAFRTGYQLVRGHNGLRVLLCVAHDEDLRAMQDPAD